MPVVPGDEFECGMASGQILTGYVEPALLECAASVDDGVVGAHQPFMRDMLADFDVEVQTHSVCDEPRAEGQAYILGLGVIRCHAAANEPVRCGQPVQQLHLDVGPGQ